MPIDTHTHVTTAQALGRVEGTLASLQKTLADMTATLEADRKEAAAVRQSINTSLHAVTTNVAALRTDMDEVKPVTEKLVRWQAVGLGAVLAVGAISSMIGAAAVYFKEIIIRLIWGP